MELLLCLVSDIQPSKSCLEITLEAIRLICENCSRKMISMWQALYADGKSNLPKNCLFMFLSCFLFLLHLPSTVLMVRIYLKQ